MMKVLNDCKKDPELALAAKAFRVLSDKEIMEHYEDYDDVKHPFRAVSRDDYSLKSDGYVEGIEQYCVSYDLWMCGAARTLFDDDQFQIRMNKVIDRLSKCVGKGTKSPDLDLLYGGDWDDGPYDLFLPGITCSELFDEEESYD